MFTMEKPGAVEVDIESQSRLPPLSACARQDAHHADVSPAVSDSVGGDSQLSRQSRKFRFQKSTGCQYLIHLLCHSLNEHRLASRPPVKAALRRATPARP